MTGRCGDANVKPCSWEKHVLSCGTVCNTAPMLLWGFLMMEMLQAVSKHGGNLYCKSCSPGKERQSNYLPRQKDALCMSNQHIWTAEDIRHQPNLGPASFTCSCSGTLPPAQTMYFTVVTRSREGRVWDSGPAFDFHLNAGDSITIRSTLNEETQTWLPENNVLTGWVLSWRNKKWQHRGLISGIHKRRI